VEVGRILIEEYGLNFPLNAEMEYLDKLYRDRVMRLARKVLSELERAIKEEKGEEALEKVEDIKDVLHKVREATVTVEDAYEKYKWWFNTTLTVASIGFSTIIFAAPWIGLPGLLASFGLKVSKISEKKVAGWITEYMLKPLPCALWNFEKELKKIKPPKLVK
jgi:hypothetical protein